MKYSALKKDIMPYTAAWMKLEENTLSKINWTW